MTFFKRARRTGAAALFATTCLTAATSAQALTAFDVTIDGDLTGQPTWNRIFGSPGGFVLSATGGDVHYQSFLITIENAANFLAQTLNIGGVSDTTMTLYQGAFDPTDQFTNAVFYDDDGGAGFYSLIEGAVDGPFAEGQYTIVISTFSNGDTGVYTLVMNGVVVGWGLAPAAQIEELKAHASVAALEVGSAAASTAFNAVKEALGGAGGGGGMSMSTKGHGATAVRPWISLNQTIVEGDDLTYRFPTIQAGADVAIGNGMVAGLSLSKSDIDAETTGSDLTGQMLTLQPYLGFSLGEATASAGIILGRSDFEELTSTGGTGSAKGETRALAFSIENPYAMGGNTLTAHFDVMRGRTEITEADGSLAGSADETINFTHASLGGTYAIATEGGVVTLGASIDYDDTDAPELLAGQVYTDNGISGSISFGASYRLGGGATADIGLELGGLRSDVRRKSIGLGVDIRF